VNAIQPRRPVSREEVVAYTMSTWKEEFLELHIFLQKANALNFGSCKEHN
jgi:hypothetical protein